MPSYTHTANAGRPPTSWCFRPNRLGLYLHGMVDLHLERAFVKLGVPAGYLVGADYAIGYTGDLIALSEPLQAREEPSLRRPLAELAFAGGLPEAT